MGQDALIKSITNLFCDIWNEIITLTWDEWLTVLIFKKEIGSDCNNYFRVRLISIFIKLFTSVFLRLKSVCEN